MAKELVGRKRVAISVSYESEIQIWTEELSPLFEEMNTQDLGKRIKPISPSGFQKLAYHTNRAWMMAARIVLVSVICLRFCLTDV